ncbi:DUF6470 family protein [Enterocloster sp. OA13]|uniref:DUF6470 family protein n=1 Tax=Enterocloster hominis (ex Hitch et al. 2024) TaxID=1917870 RepID=A0ABV1CZY3_9FIRM|nr:DUF6470 family protein [Lachnoclostridium pacaense]EEQ58970.1 hypothetical protein CBFG_02680 [Clostridiales bacterium 1_7_47FAA]MCD8171812.1 DUF6470 family protein [Clostridiales bacterium]MCH1952020.1 DUF6470 family protein [Enterocloster sp. OA13]RJW34447.1 hypothetical protein DXC92_26530 [Clostridiales bacterium TF09-2AC]MCC2820584.1 DUF6470 family protein [Lachnoclostridium pacaense]
MNVLKITTTPIKLSMTSQRARLESRIPDPEVGIIQNPGKLNMKSENIKVDIDTSRSRDSMGFRTARGIMRDGAQAGIKAASDATAQYSRIGNQMMQIQDGVTVADIMKNQMMAQTNITTGIAFIPSVGPDISWQPPDLSIDYTPAQVEFRPQVQEPPATYVPGELRVDVEQYPKVDIEYMGEPMYVPPSANPAHEAAAE